LIFLIMGVGWVLSPLGSKLAFDMHLWECTPKLGVQLMGPAQGFSLCKSWSYSEYNMISDTVHWEVSLIHHGFSGRQTWFKYRNWELGTRTKISFSKSQVRWWQLEWGSRKHASWTKKKRCWRHTLQEKPLRGKIWLFHNSSLLRASKLQVKQRN
jgi:hypothetical protein